METTKTKTDGGTELFRVAFGDEDGPMFTNPKQTLAEVWPERYALERADIPVVRIERMNDRKHWETYTGADNVISLHPHRKEGETSA